MTLILIGLLLLCEVNVKTVAITCIVSGVFNIVLNLLKVIFIDNR